MPKVGKKKFPYTAKGVAKAIKEGGKNRRRRRSYKRIEKEANRDADTLRYANQRKGQPDAGNEGDPLFRARVSNVDAEKRAGQRTQDLNYLNKGGGPRKQKKRFRRYKLGL